MQKEGTDKSILLIRSLLEELAKEKIISEKQRSKITDVLETKFAESDVNIPVRIFAGKLSPAEALYKYLIEEEGMRYVDIAHKLGRDERGIWGSYNKAKQKMPAKFKVKNDIIVPFRIFDGKHSVFATVVKYLKEQKKMKLREIADLLKKATSTIGVTYTRTK